MVYSVALDAGVYNVGLNFGLCEFMAIFGGVDVMTSAVRTVSLKFNTFNGQQEGLFSSVDITARFSLGESTMSRVVLTSDGKNTSVPSAQNANY